MTLPAIVDDLTDLPEGAAKFYAKRGDRYVVDVRTVDGTGVGDLGRITQALLESRLRAEIEKAGASADLVLPLALKRARLNPLTLRVEALKEDGTPALIVVGGNDVIPGGAAELVDALARDRRYAPAFESREKAADGDKPKAEPANLTQQSLAIRAKQAAPADDSARWPNPWRAENFNLSRQCMILRRDPQRAERLKAEANQ